MCVCVCVYTQTWVYLNGKCACVGAPRVLAQLWTAVPGAPQRRPQTLAHQERALTGWKAWCWPTLHHAGSSPAFILSSQKKIPEKWSIDVCVCAHVHMCTQSCQTLCNPMDCSPTGSSAHGIFQARLLESVAIPFSRRSSQPRDQNHVSCGSCTGRQILYHWATWEAQEIFKDYKETFKGRWGKQLGSPSLACHSLLTTHTLTTIHAQTHRTPTDHTTSTGHTAISTPTPPCGVWPQSPCV